MARTRTGSPAENRGQKAPSSAIKKTPPLSPLRSRAPGGPQPALSSFPADVSTGNRALPGQPCFGTRSGDRLPHPHLRASIAGRPRPPAGPPPGFQDFCSSTLFPRNKTASKYGGLKVRLTASTGWRSPRLSSRFPAPQALASRKSPNLTTERDAELDGVKTTAPKTSAAKRARFCPQPSSGTAGVEGRSLQGHGPAPRRWEARPTLHGPLCPPQGRGPQR